ncbi:MAG: hypothetical protein WC635_06905 [Bacteriovorax sp.]
MFTISHDKLKTVVNNKSLPYIYIALYLIIFYFFDHKAIMYIAASLILIEIFKKHKWTILFLINMYALIYDKLATHVKAHFKIELIDILDLSLPGYSYESIPVREYILLAMLVFMFFIALLFFAIKKYKLKISPFLAIVVTLLLWNFLGVQRQLGSIGLIWGILLLHSVFFLIYEFSNADVGGGVKTFLQRVTLAIPFWQLTSSPIMPVLMGSQYANRVETNDEDQKNELRLRAVKQIFVLFCIKIFVRGLLIVLADKGFILNITQTRMEKIMNSNLSHSTWLTLGSHYINFIIIEVIVEAGAIITMLWMLGCDVANNTNRIEKSYTISDLMKRLYFYYNQMIVSFFIMPVYSMLRNVFPSKRVKWFTSVFVGVFVGGMCFSTLRAALLVNTSNSAYWSSLGGRSLYFISLAFALSISSLNLFQVKEEDHWSKRILATIFVFTIYFVMFISEIKPYRIEFEDRLRFLGRLFGII